MSDDFSDPIGDQSFRARYQIDGNDSWVDEVDALTIDDLDHVDPSMMEEAERRSTRLAIENQILRSASTDLFVYSSLRYGRYCPDPARVIYPHQSIVIDDLMTLDRPDTHRQYCLTAPRGFVKTSTVSDWLEWKLGRSPWIRSKLVAAAERGSIQQLGLMRRNIMLDPLFKAIFPDARVDMSRPNNKTNLSLVVPSTMVDTRNASIEAWGIGSSPERGRAEIIWYDDVCTYENTIKEPKERENIKEKLKVTWFPLRSGPETIFVWTFTPFHDLDASMEIFKSKGGWRKRFITVSRDFSCLEDQVTHDKLPLPDERWDPTLRKFIPWWNKSELLKLYHNDPEEFRVAYWLETVTQESDSATWNSVWIYGNEEAGTEGAVEFGFGPQHQLYKCPIIAIGVDLAFSRSAAAKNTAITVCGFREDGKKVLLDVDYGHGWGTSKKIEKIVAMSSRWSPDIIVVEDNSAQTMLVDLLTDSNITGTRVMPFTTDIYKDAKLRVLSNEYKDGFWSIPFENDSIHYQGSGCKCGRCFLIREMLSYPNFETSDCLMSHLFAKEGLKELVRTKKNLEFGVLHI